MLLIVPLSGYSQKNYTEKRYPAFLPFKENYFVLGFDTSKKPDQYSSGAKFQISMAFHLWTISSKWDVFAVYTQRSLWDLFQRSLPFRENAFNPGLWFSYQHSEKLKFFFGIEHMSNGQVGSSSRSFNSANVAVIWDASSHWRLGGRAFLGYYEFDTTPHWHRYVGHFKFWTVYSAVDGRLRCTVDLIPADYFKKINFEASVSYRLSRKKTLFPSLFLQYSNAYADSMVEYTRRVSYLRLGFSVVPWNVGVR